MTILIFFQIQTEYMNQLNNNYQHISHDSIEPFIGHNSKILILGSFPSVKTRELGFYYGHSQNRFYRVISKIYDEDIPISIEDKKMLLNKHHIALYDVIYECDIIGSSDSSIKNVIPINIKVILDRYPNIKVIILNGSLARSLFDKYLLKDIDNKTISIRYCPSTSPANAKVSVDQLVDIYKEALK